VNTVGVPRETFPGERRVALTPSVVAVYQKAGLSAVVEAGAGEEAGYPDAAFKEAGAEIATSREAVFRGAEAILQVRTIGANPEAGRADLSLLKPEHIVVGLSNSLAAPDALKELVAHGSTVFAMELIPRITRAQSMDALSSQASIAGYKAVLLVADALPKLFPMMTTAAGTIPPAKVLVLGAGVAGLQAIATARRLGAVVQSYDVRPEVKEQVESLGATFVELELDTAEAQGTGGYAGKQSEEFLAKQREALGKVIAENDAVITTALVPGAKAPVLMNADMVRGMAFGSVVLDMAAEQGGNVELSRPDEVIVEGGVTVLGPTNISASLPFDASQMYAKNVQNFIASLMKEDGFTIDMDDEVTSGTLLARGGEIVHPRVREAFGLPALATPDPEPEPELEPKPEPNATTAAAADASKESQA